MVRPRAWLGLAAAWWSLETVVAQSTTAAAASAASPIAGVPSGGQCASPEMRQEWRQGTEAQRQAYLSAVKVLKSRTGSSGSITNPATASWDDFVKVHWDHVAEAHGVPAFLPWHRAYLHMFHQALKSVDPTVPLFYWDWRLDSQNLAGSDILGASAFGGGGAAPDYCVTTGAFAGWQVAFPASPTRPNTNACLARQFNFGAGYDPTAIANMYTISGDFETLRSKIEGGPHGTIHNGVGGPWGDMTQMYSTNDPLFFMHHGMIDKLWHDWQVQCEDFQRSYQGKNPDGSTAATTDVLKPYGWTVGQMLQTRGGTPLCYGY
ncbi:hypothetical protein CXG81DRAFT_12738, partial [Caulochytrium protostelioides]